MNAVLDLERRIGVTQRWTPADPEYQEALKYLHNRRFIHAVQQLEGLVVQRLFELAKANLASTGTYFILMLAFKIRLHAV